MHDVHACSHAAENGVGGVETRIVDGVDEELTAVGVRAAVGHGYYAGKVVVVRTDLVVELVAGAAGTPRGHLRVILGQWVAALDHETFDHTVKFGAVVK